MPMINCRETKILGRNFFKVRRLYLSAFPKIERHELMELFSASSKGKAEFLQFTEDGKFLGLAYVIVRGSVAFLLYFAVEESRRNRGYGSAILETIRKKYAGKDIVHVISTLYASENSLCMIASMTCAVFARSSRLIPPCENGMAMLILSPSVFASYLSKKPFATMPTRPASARTSPM